MPHEIKDLQKFQAPPTAGLRLNCVSYDPRAAHQCRDRRADPVQEKAAGNFCEYFDFARRQFVAKTEANPREDAARSQLKKLFGD